MIIEIFPSGPFETNAYVVGCPETRTAAIIDPAPESASKIIQFLTDNQLKPDKILLTHTHWDHIADVGVLKTKYSLPVYVHADDVGNLMNPGSDGIPFWVSIESIRPDFLLEENEEIPVGNLRAKVIETPGHSAGGVCFYFDEPKVLISGDTLFKGSIGNLSFPKSEPQKMWDSLKKLSHLPKETKVYPGHGPMTTIGNEPWLKRAEQTFGE